MIRIPATYLDKESDGLTAIQETVVVGEGEIHHLSARINTFWSQDGKTGGWVLSYRPDLDLAVDSDRLVLDGVETQNGWREVCQRTIANY